MGEGAECGYGLGGSAGGRRAADEGAGVAADDRAFDAAAVAAAIMSAMAVIAAVAAMIAAMAPALRLSGRGQHGQRGGGRNQEDFLEHDTSLPDQKFDSNALADSQRFQPPRLSRS